MEMLLPGALLGPSIAVPPGPNAAVCMRRMLTVGRRVGFRCGLGAASPHACYSALGGGGRGPSIACLEPGYRPLRVAGGLVLVMLVLRLGRGGAPALQPSGGGASLPTLAVGLTNPSPSSTSPRPWRPEPSPPAGPLVVVGVFAGSAAWWAALTCVVGVLQRHLSDRHLAWAKRVTVSAMGACGLMAVAVVH